MTCIIAAVSPTHAAMAADRQIVDGYVAHLSRAPKIIKKGSFVMGTAGPVRINNAIKTGFTPPAPPRVMTEDWIALIFVPTLIEAMTATKIAVIDGWLGGKESEQQGTLLCACPGAIFTIQADWAIDLWDEPYAAIGSGSRYALGAMHALTSFHPPTDDQMVDHLTHAMAAVRRFDLFSSGDPDILTVSKGS